MISRYRRPGNGAGNTLYGGLMPFKPWVRSITPLAWFMFVSTFANVITAGGVLYLALRDEEVWVRGGGLTAYVDQRSYRDSIRVRIDR